MRRLPLCALRPLPERAGRENRELRCSAEWRRRAYAASCAIVRARSPAARRAAAERWAEVPRLPASPPLPLPPPPLRRGVLRRRRPVGVPVLLPLLVREVVAGAGYGDAAVTKPGDAAPAAMDRASASSASACMRAANAASASASVLPPPPSLSDAMRSMSLSLSSTTTMLLCRDRGVAACPPRGGYDKRTPPPPAPAVTGATPSLRTAAGTGDSAVAANASSCSLAAISSSFLARRRAARCLACFARVAAASVTVETRRQKRMARPRAGARFRGLTYTTSPSTSSDVSEMAAPVQSTMRGHVDGDVAVKPRRPATDRTKVDHSVVSSTRALNAFAGVGLSLPPSKWTVITLTSPTG